MWVCILCIRSYYVYKGLYHIGMPNVTQSTVTSLWELYVLGFSPSPSVYFLSHELI